MCDVFYFRDGSTHGTVTVLASMSSSPLVVTICRLLRC